jgi:hypothetical protein
MRQRRTLQARFAGFVALTLLLAALLPTLSHAVLARDSAVWAEICTATGAKFVRVDMAAEPDSPAGSMPAGAMDCGYCSLHHGPPLPLPAEALWQPPGALKFERPLLFLAAPRPLFAWAPALARGPPALS